MRMFSWLTKSEGADRATHGVLNGIPDLKMAKGQRPVVEIPPISSSGKRSWASEVPDMMTPDAHDRKRTKTTSFIDSAIDIKDCSLNNDVKAADDLSQVCEVIESQFSLEILLKHDELRLIKQELAKCQVALEQLRRCHLIPYPVSLDTPESMFNITNGTGPAVSQTGNVPQWAPPYGVADGPYTRHYAKWLITDPNFEDLEWHWHYESRARKFVSEGRSTRHSIVENSSASRSRSQRGPVSDKKLQALSSGYPQPKEKPGPCILKRGDGQMVKLVCNNCQREDFNSTQGFINHCRISHKIEYKSHEEAAIACGVPYEIDEATTTATDEKHSEIATGLVHPLITSSATDTNAYASLLSRMAESIRQYEQGKLLGIMSIPSSEESTSDKPFVPSSKAPHLSDWIRKKKDFSGSLVEMVDQAKQRVDFDDILFQDEDSEDEKKLGELDDTDSPLPAMRPLPRASMAPVHLGRPTSSKGMDVTGRKPGISSRMTPTIDTDAANQVMHQVHSSDDDSYDEEGDVIMTGPSLSDLSPNTNKPPSLVSDDGEYDDGDDAESGSEEEEEEGSDVAEIVEDIEGVKVVPRTVLRNRSGSIKKEEKHVTFVPSPVKERKERQRK
ncbi:hypothetical protein B0O99DRAFT_114072 [Bisporella sp. PMI_857]|nr:hypothetical protein B0O99DRAFT_114072 [Bisporella sp. PMI_857]